MKRMVYAAVLAIGLAWGGSVNATIIWSNCPGGDLTDEICPDQYDIEVCNADVNEPVDQCSCEHHGYTWTGDSCE